MTHHTIGIDISKAHLDAYAAPAGSTARFSNDAAGLRKLIAWIGPEAGRIAYEPSGPWHRDLEDALLKAGLPLYAINPYQVRCFARSRGCRAKTDAVDARTLAIMADAIGELRPTAAKSRSDRDLSELQLVRDALVGDRKPSATAANTCATPSPSDSTSSGWPRSSASSSASKPRSARSSTPARTSSAGSKS